MPTPLEDVEALYAAMKNLRAERAKMERLSDKAFNAEGQKSMQKANVDLNWQAFHVTKLEHDVHALAVDCGFADVRSEAHYRPYSVKLTGFHEYEVLPRRPRALSQAKPEER